MKLGILEIAGSIHSLDAKRNKTNQTKKKHLSHESFLVLFIYRVVGLVLGGLIIVLLCCFGFFLNFYTYPAQKGASWIGMKKYLSIYLETQCESHHEQQAWTYVFQYMDLV